MSHLSLFIVAGELPSSTKSSSMPRVLSDSRIAVCRKCRNFKMSQTYPGNSIYSR